MTTLAEYTGLVRTVDNASLHAAANIVAQRMYPLTLIDDGQTARSPTKPIKALPVAILTSDRVDDMLWADSLHRQYPQPCGPGIDLLSYSLDYVRRGDQASISPEAVLQSAISTIPEDTLPHGKPRSFFLAFSLTGESTSGYDCILEYASKALGNLKLPVLAIAIPHRRDTVFLSIAERFFKHTPIISAESTIC